MSFLILLSHIVSAQTFKWASKIKGTYIASTYGVVADKDSSYYICGEYMGSITLSGTTYRHTPGLNQSPDSYLIKYDKNRAVQWFKSAKGGAYDNNISTIVDQAGNIYVLGFAEHAFIDDTTNPVSGYYLAKYTSEGNLLWIKVLYEWGDTSFSRLKLDASGNIFVTAFTRLPGPSDLYEPYIKKLNPDGEELLTWAVPSHEALALDQEGNLYLTGPTREHGSYIRKYDNSGQLIWEKIIYSSYSAYTKDIVVDQQGNIYISGDHCGKATLGNYQVEKLCLAPGTQNIFIAMLDKNGKELWLKSIGGELHNRNGQLVINQDKVYFAGIIAEKGEIAGVPTINGLGIFQIDQTGAILWFKQVPGKYLLGHPVAVTAYRAGLLVAGTMYADTAEDFMDFDGYRLACEPGQMTLFMTYLEPGNACLAPVPKVLAPVSVCRGSEAVSITAEGEHIEWYSDALLSAKIAEGNLFQPVISATSTYYVTQTIEGCQSRPASVMVHMKEKPLRPAVSDVAYCRGDVPQPLRAQGQHINWYSNAALTTRLASGNSFLPVITASASFYATQTVDGCESEPVEVKMLIKETPPTPQVNTVFVCGGKMLAPLIASGANITWYADPGLTHKIGEGNHFFTEQKLSGSVYVRQQLNGCMSAAAKIDLAEGISTYTKQQLPNVITPNGDDKNELFSLPDLAEGDCTGTFHHVKIYNRWGKNVYTNEDKNFRWRAEGLPNGIYFYLITFANHTYKGQVSVLR
jgi:gliding motility-associated-like protein